MSTALERETRSESSQVLSLNFRHPLLQVEGLLQLTDAAWLIQCPINYSKHHQSTHPVEAAPQALAWGVPRKPFRGQSRLLRELGHSSHQWSTATLAQLPHWS